MEKKQLRLELQERLRKFDAGQISRKSEEASRKLISTSQFQDASVIMMYLSIPYEADITEAILQAWRLGKSVVVPKISRENKHMAAVKIDSTETGLANGVSGLRNPLKGVPIPLQEIDLVVAPALGFDKKGNRLGRGGGYYDRFFANKNLKAQRCGLAFQEQLVDSVPVTDKDQPVHFLVTDEKVIYLNPGEHR